MRTRHLALWIIGPLGALALAAAGCGDDGGSGPGGGGDGDGGGTGGMDGSTPGGDGGGTTGDGGGTGEPGDGGTDGGWTGWGDGGCVPFECKGKIFACGDCLDNDGDGRIDSHDPDCLGPCDNNEEGYYLHIPGGDSSPCKQDCYYDHDQGSGNDECEWDHRCDEWEPSAITGKCDYEPEDERGGDYVFIGSVDEDGNPTCTLDDVEDTELCRPCTPVGDCLNECERCELCIGKTELPDDCRRDPPPPDGGVSDGGVPDGGVPDGGYDERCPGGEQPCGLEGDDPCPPDRYCITGCCQVSDVF